MNDILHFYTVRLHRSIKPVAVVAQITHIKHVLPASEKLQTYLGPMMSRVFG